uniref:Uncharacterized protein n=1 Tax=Chromera velia CCMP2878 TaxID=1169474 RepID=A0A0G4FAU7_9ALVE|eukprot:Cvel_15954.t1-p1 / transcript=Cvel_15954.t1 / gene=Cvel_15954 / organism=Chromera_velia_CCMP2878 / gene_product=hypothetical protein / transcript_product=hypothetical protein / location=Cvel_scaffold1207:7471-7900(+) / protein_length=79 / sequence_SO=supercontig / SO=protein_coding / is_pseudo=false
MTVEDEQWESEGTEELFDQQEADKQRMMHVLGVLKRLGAVRRDIEGGRTGCVPHSLLVSLFFCLLSFRSAPVSLVCLCE